MSAAQQLIERGQRLGRTDGRRDVLRKQMRLKFGPLPARVGERLAAASDRDLDRFTARILEARTIDDVIGRSRRAR